MKKIFVAAMVVAGFTFMSCGNKTDSNATEADTVMVENTEASAENIKAELQSKIDSNDSDGFKEVINKAKDKITELQQNGKIEEAKEYLAQVQGFLKENAEAVKGFGNETINKLVDGVQAIPTETLDALTKIGSNAETAAENAKEDIENKATEAVDKAKEKANEAVEKANEAVDNAKNKAKEDAEKAKEKARKEAEKANEKVNEATNKAINKVLGK